MNDLNKYIKSGYYKHIPLKYSSLGDSTKSQLNITKPQRCQRLGNKISDDYRTFNTGEDVSSTVKKSNASCRESKMSQIGGVIKLIEAFERVDTNDNLINSFLTQKSSNSFRHQILNKPNKSIISSLKAKYRKENIILRTRNEELKKELKNLQNKENKLPNKPPIPTILRRENNEKYGRSGKIIKKFINIAPKIQPNSTLDKSLQGNAYYKYLLRQNKELVSQNKKLKIKYNLVLSQIKKCAYINKVLENKEEFLVKLKDMEINMRRVIEFLGGCEDNYCRKANRSIDKGDIEDLNFDKNVCDECDNNNNGYNYNNNNGIKSTSRGRIKHNKIFQSNGGMNRYFVNNNSFVE